MRFAVREAARIAGAQDFADDAGIVGNSQLAAGHTQRRPADEDVIRLVPEEDAGRSASSNLVEASAI